MKKINAPLRHDPGRGYPTEHLAYLSPMEMEMLRRLTDGTVSRGPRGIPSFADDSAGNYNGGYGSAAPSKSTNQGPTGGLGSNYSPSSSYNTPSGSSGGSSGMGSGGGVYHSGAAPVGGGPEPSGGGSNWGSGGGAWGGGPGGSSYAGGFGGNVTGAGGGGFGAGGYGSSSGSRGFMDGFAAGLRDMIGSPQQISSLPQLNALTSSQKYQDRVPMDSAFSGVSRGNPSAGKDQSRVPYDGAFNPNTIASQEVPSSAGYTKYTGRAGISINPDGSVRNPFGGNMTKIPGMVSNLVQSKMPVGNVASAQKPWGYDYSSEAVPAGYNQAYNLNQPERILSVENVPEETPNVATGGNSYAPSQEMPNPIVAAIQNRFEGVRDRVTGLMDRLGVQPGTGGPAFRKSFMSNDSGSRDSGSKSQNDTEKPDKGKPPKKPKPKGKQNPYRWTFPQYYSGFVPPKPPWMKS